MGKDGEDGEGKVGKAGRKDGEVEGWRGDARGRTVAFRLLSAGCAAELERSD